MIEVRRCEAAIRTWEADPGEYYHSFTGEYGGLWRHQGDTAPQRLAGVGFVAEGFDKSSYYRRLPASRDPRARFIFEGIDEEIIGDFGYHGEGAAGNELDYADARLGTPPHALVVARSENHTDLYLVVNEEVLVNHSGLGGTEHEKVHADMVFYETPGWRRGLLGGLDLLSREPAVEGLRQQHREAHHQRAPPLRRPHAILRTPESEPAMSVLLRQVTLQNYKSIGQCKVDLSELNVLVGANGTGKSNFIDAISLVSESLSETLDYAIRHRGGINEVRRRSGGHPSHFAIGLRLRLDDEVNASFAFRIGALSEGRSAYSRSKRIFRVATFSTTRTT